MSYVGHDTSEMRNWSAEVENIKAEYDEDVAGIYNTVEELVSSDFTGGLSQDFENAVMDKKQYFTDLSSFVEDAVELIKEIASAIDDDEAQLKSNFNSSSAF